MYIKIPKKFLLKRKENMKNCKSGNTTDGFDVLYPNSKLFVWNQLMGIGIAAFRWKQLICFIEQYQGKHNRGKQLK